MIYPSELAAQALQIAPTGTPHAAPPCACAMCARAIGSGDLSARLVLTRTFTDFSSLVPSDFVCGFCEATTHQDIMRELQRSVITAQGVYNLNKDESRAWFWLTPPEPPYVVVINHSVMGAFHYFWRTPVTLDSNLIQVNVDGTVYRVRRQRVLQALEHGRALIERAPVLARKKGALKSPFQTLMREAGRKPSERHGWLAPDCHTLAAMFDDCREAVAFLTALTPGELFALTPLLKQNPSAPVRPELLSRFVAGASARPEH
jgi:CRISPR type IV-associated protein Csf1